MSLRCGGVSLRCGTGTSFFKVGDGRGASFCDFKDEEVSLLTGGRGEGAEVDGGCCGRGGPITSFRSTGEGKEGCSFLTCGEEVSLRPVLEVDSLRGEEFSRRRALGGIGAGGPVTVGPDIGLGEEVMVRLTGEEPCEVFGR